MRPISSMWADSMRDGPAPAPLSVACTDPMTSVLTSSAVSAKRSRTRRATAISVPVAEGVSSSSLRNLTCFFFMALPAGSRAPGRQRSKP